MLLYKVYNIINCNFDILEDGPVTNKADIWACGLVVWEMIALSAPHIESSEMEDSYLDDSMLEMKMKNNITNECDTNMDNSNSFLNKIINTKYGKCLNNNK